VTIELALVAGPLPRRGHHGRPAGQPAGPARRGPHTGCGTTRLVESLWPERQPEHPAKAPQVLVSRARARLGADTVAATPTGYRLTLTDDQIDARLRFARLGAYRSLRRSRALALSRLGRRTEAARSC
jgi:hypothetical protein